MIYKKDFKYYLSHIPWILNVCAIIYCFIMFVTITGKYPYTNHSIKYICIDKQIGNSRYGEKTYFLNIQDVKTKKITSKNVTLNTYYNNNIGDYLYFTEYYSDIPNNIWKKAKIYLFTMVGLLIILIFTLNIAKWY